MQVKKWLVVCALVLAACEWKVPNKEYCPPGRECPDVISCNSSGECEDPVPVCKQETMTCVECTADEYCPEAAPKCDLQTNKCVQCTKHADCESDICLDTQVCADPADVLHVSANGTANMTCSKTNPCNTLKQALGSAELRKYIKVTGMITDAAETVFVGDVLGKPVHVYGNPGSSVLTRLMNGVVMSMSKGAEVTLVDLEIKSTAATSDGIEIKDIEPKVTLIRTKVSGHSGKGASLATGSLTLISSQVFENRTFGIDVVGGTLTLEGSWVYGNIGDTAIRVTGTMSKVTISSSVIAGNGGLNGGLDIASPFSITNTVIVGNGKSITGLIGGASLRASMGTFMFNTVADNIAGTGVSSGVICGGMTKAISNSIVTNNAIDATCTSVSYTLTNVALPGQLGMNNIMGDPKFIDTRTLLGPTFYRIASDSAAKDKADTLAPVMDDIDGEARDDGMKDIGADEYTAPQ